MSVKIWFVAKRSGYGGDAAAADDNHGKRKMGGKSYYYCYYWSLLNFRLNSFLMDSLLG